MTASNADNLTEADRKRVHRSAVRVGLWVGFACAAVVGIIIAVIIAVSVAGSRLQPDTDGDGFVLSHGPSRVAGSTEMPQGRVIDLGSTIVLAATLGAAGVLALGVLAWWMSRRATEPLAQALQAQRAFVADASHELRTPLTALVSRIQLAQHRAERGGDVTGALIDLRRDAERMNAVLTDLLITAETAATQEHDDEDRPVTAIAAVAQDAVAVIQPRADAARVPVTISVEDRTQAFADSTALTRALIALLDNAVRHSSPGAMVAVTGRTIGSRVEVRIYDRGTGIAGDPERLFERFARGGASPDGRSGFGLGLALVRDIVARAGGRVVIERTSTAPSDHGTTFLLTLQSARA